MIKKHIGKNSILSHKKTQKSFNKSFKKYLTNDSVSGKIYRFTALPLYRLRYFYPNKFTPKYKCSHREKGNKNIAPNGMCDKQFGSNGASLFIFRVCLIGKLRILYAVCNQTA